MPTLDFDAIVMESAFELKQADVNAASERAENLSYFGPGPRFNMIAYEDQ
jgi:hypothetical protein